MFHQIIKATPDAIDMEHVEARCPLYDTDVSKMTNSRLFARFMSRFRFYNPQAGRTNSDYNTVGKPLPSLDKAWAYWEHVTLARRFQGNAESHGEYVRAPVGEKKECTELYPILQTPVKELMGFGVSVRMYFTTLLTLSVFLMIAGVLNLPLAWYFWNYAEDGHKDGIPNSVRPSAICDDAEWVQCEDCYQYDFPAYRLDGGKVLINTCNFDDWLIPGLFSYLASILLIVLFGITYFWLQRKAEIVFDEEIQTASDYSIKISNPPKDALNPDEWRHFFKPFASKNVTLVTVALDNAELINVLVQRRIFLKQLGKMLKTDVDVMDGAALKNAVIDDNTPRWMLHIPFLETPQSLYAKVWVLENVVKGLVQRDYCAVAVYVTFETERAQRSCLHALTTGKLNVWRNKVDASRFDGRELKVQEAAASSKLDVKDLAGALKEARKKEMSIRLAPSSDSVSVDRMLAFRGVKVLNVKEAGEPNDVRWKDLQASSSLRATQFSGTTLLMMIFVGWSGFFIASLQENYPNYTPLYITVTNIIVPKICGVINAIESHSTEGNRNASLYIKVAIFRWFNSAVCLLIISSSIEIISVENGNETAKPSLTTMVFAIIFAEMFTVPILKVADIMGNIRKHILAPRATDQEEMNSCFGGGKFELAERYSDATKVVFVSLFYSAILPQSLFLGSIALVAHFWSGKFCLLRLWRATPDIGPHLARVSRNYFFSTSLLVHVIMSAYFWSGYPYDNVCEVDGVYQYCKQDMLRSRIFPPLPSFQPDGMTWMSQSQATLTSLYGYTSLVLVAVAIFVILKELLLPFIEGLFRSTYEPDGEDQGRSFSSVKHRQEVHGYIPQVVVEGGFAHPLIACDISKVDKDLIGWNDHLQGFEKHNLVSDVRSILKGREPTKPVFSIVKHWPNSPSNK
jgi:hypothetical protein